MLSLHDHEAFEQAMEHILELDPRFVPRDEERQAWIRALAGVVGTRRAILALSWIKKWLGRV